jgi:ATP-dependent RNA helicase DeaD
VTISGGSEDGADRPSGATPPDHRSEVDAPTSDGDFLQVFINVGRREGLQAGDLQKLLSDKGLGEVSSAGIRVRDRAAFVRVRRDLFDRAVAALSGEVIGGRTVVAELARER